MSCHLSVEQIRSFKENGYLAIDSLLGGELTSNPVQQVRMKPPLRELDREQTEHSNIGATRWHQDTVALTPDADGPEMLTIWVAITEATVDTINSLLQAYYDGD